MKNFLHPWDYISEDKIMKFKMNIVHHHSHRVDPTDPGNKMDATNLATIFAPNLLHTLPEDVAEKAAAAAGAASPTSTYSGSKGGGGGGGAAFLSSTTSSFSAMATGSPERMEYVAAVRFVIITGPLTPYLAEQLRLRFM